MSEVKEGQVYKWKKHKDVGYIVIVYVGQNGFTFEVFDNHARYKGKGTRKSMKEIEFVIGTTPILVSREDIIWWKIK